MLAGRNVLQRCTLAMGETGHLHIGGIMQKTASLKAIFPLVVLGLVGLAGCALDARPGGEGSRPGVSTQVGTEDTQTAEPTASVTAALSSSVTAFAQWNGTQGFGYNPTGDAVVVSHLALGQYEADYYSMSGYFSSSDVEATAAGGGLETRCKVLKWQVSTGLLRIFINCFAAGGGATDTPWYMAFMRRTDTPGAQGAYVWASLPSSTSYNVTSFTWNSAGGTNSITHTPGTGVYTVNLAGQDLSNGTVQVTAYGSGNAYCKVTNWFGTTAGVICFNGSTGQQVESQFDLLFEAQAPENTPTFTYLWTDQPGGNGYNPDQNYELGVLGRECGNVTEPDATIDHPFTGYYQVIMPGVAMSNNFPIVTGYGSGSETCEIAAVFADGSDAQVDVDCFDPSGNPVDAQFTLTYSSEQYLIC